MPKTLVYQGFSALREEVVRSEGRSSRSPVQQALSYNASTVQERRPFGRRSFLLTFRGPSDRPNGDPARAQQSGSCGERRNSGMSELFRMRGSEGYRACDDERLLVALPSSASAELQRFDCSRTPSIWTAFFFANVPWAFRPSKWGPRTSPAKRVVWGEEEQRHERAFPHAGKRGI